MSKELKRDEVRSMMIIDELCARENDTSVFWKMVLEYLNLTRTITVLQLNQVIRTHLQWSCEYLDSLLSLCEFDLFIYIFHSSPHHHSQWLSMPGWTQLLTNQFQDTSPLCMTIDFILRCSQVHNGSNCWCDSQRLKHLLTLISDAKRIDLFNLVCDSGPTAPLNRVTRMFLFAELNSILLDEPRSDLAGSLRLLMS
jgi:hypothetical protein